MAASSMPVLWHIEISHYNEKARWALDFKRVAHVRRTPQPGLHALTAWRLTRHSTLPILQLDGTAIGDSTRIIAALEERYPEPPLYPPGGRERQRALELEEFFDARVAPSVRRLVFHHVLRGPGAREAALELSPPGAGRRVVRWAFPLMRRGVAARYGVYEDRMDAAVRDIREGLARIVAEAGPTGHLVGDAFSVADLTAAALLGPLVQPAQFPYPLPELPPALGDLIAGLDGAALDWVRETYAVHRPPSAEA